MKKVLFFMLCVIMLSCGKQSKSIFDLHEESLSSGVLVDTIMDRLWFGMSREQVDTALFLNVFERFNFNVREFSDIDFIVKSSYFNDSLYRINFLTFDKYYKYTDVLNIYKLKYGIPDTVIVKKENVENYWFSGNLQVTLEKSESRYPNFSIEYRDLRRNVYVRPLIVGKGDSFLDYYTPKYYEKSYKPNEIEKLKGI